MSENERMFRTRLEGKVAIITGGASGIGLATAEMLADYNVHCVIVDLQPNKVQEVCALIDRDHLTSLGLVLDIRSEEDMASMAQQTIGRFGRIDMLVHCAAILRGQGCGPKVLAETDVTEWDEVIATNLKGTFLCNRTVLPSMIRQHGGHIINIASISGKKGRAYDSAYCASKAGVIALTESLAEEVRQYGIKAQVIMPDAVATPIWNQNGPIPPPAYALSPERVADLLLYMLACPQDTLLDNMVIAPFFSRRRKKKKN